MTLTEIPSWKKWGLHGVFEWHENQAIIAYVFRLSDNKKIHFREIFILHFLNGILAGIAFPFIISLFDFSTSVTPISWNTLWFYSMDPYIDTDPQTNNWIFTLESPFRPPARTGKLRRTCSIWL